MFDEQFHAVVTRPGLVGEIRRVLGPCDHQVVELNFVELEDLARQRCDEAELPRTPDYRDLIVQVDQFEQFDEVMATLYGDAKLIVLLDYLEEHSSPRLLPRRPRFLIPRVEPGDPDIRTFLGSGGFLPYSRWNLDDLFGVDVLRDYALYESDATLIRLLVRGSDLLKLQELRRQFERSNDCEQLAGLADAAIMASRHASVPSEPIGFETITRMCELRDNYLERSTLLAVGFGLAQVYKTHWWSTVERISLDRLCAEVGLKRDRCGEPEIQLWSRIRQELTRIDRWYDLPTAWSDNGEDEASSSSCPVPISISQVISRAINVARDRCPRVFAELKYRQDMIESYAGNRPVLVAHEVECGWLIQYRERGHPLRESSFTEKPGQEKSGRLSRLLLPMMEKMHRDIVANIEVSECGWVPIQQIDPQSATKASVKFRKDKSHLAKELQAIGIEIESDERKIRLDQKLAEKRALVVLVRS